MLKQIRSKTLPFSEVLRKISVTVMAMSTLYQQPLYTHQKFPIRRINPALELWQKCCPQSTKNLYK